MYAGIHFYNQLPEINMMKQTSFLILTAFWLCFSCHIENKEANTHTDTTSHAQLSGDSAVTRSFTNPVMPGDYPDPSVAKIGDTYWATATSSEWAPLFPLMRSNDLIHWETIGHVFPKGTPEWADGNFWAPEISFENGKVYIYYTAHKKGGNLCVGVASASNPEGPYTDHGPLVCQKVGSIDGFPMRDENGKLYLIWKEDGNSQKLPTPIWAQPMNEERTALTGAKSELFRNDPKTWEGGLVEAPAVIRRGDYFYIFYAGDACCGRGCTYAEGVARSKKLLGPWEKYGNNPVLLKNGAWNCPGHGTVITANEGKDYFLYHAYNTESSVYTGRQGLLSEVTWTSEGWPKFSEVSPAAEVNQQAPDWAEEFSSFPLPVSWQWPVGKEPAYSITGDKLTLTASPDKIGAVLGQRTQTDEYMAATGIDLTSFPQQLQAGLAAVGDRENAVGISVSSTKLTFWTLQGNQEKVVAQAAIPKASAIQLRLTAQDGSRFKAAWSTDGSTWNPLQGEAEGAYLPPWDRGVRIGLIAKGPATTKASFDWLHLTDQK
jgi:beta-xylosidase